VTAREAFIHRVLGAVRFVDATTGAAVRSPIELESDEATTWQRNASGAYVVVRAAGFDAYTGHDPTLTDAQMEALFRSPPVVPTAARRFTATAPSEEYLPRRFVLTLPRAGDNLFAPLEVPLYRATSARPFGAGPRLYVSVQDDRKPPVAIPGALVVVTIDGAEACRTTTGPTGEAVVELVERPTFVTGDGGPVTTSEFEAVVAVAVDPALLARDDDGRWALKTPPDPDPASFDLAGAKKATTIVKLSAGRFATATLPISLP
jgi:hypothetical protein